ncbi:hypothetical protein RvY_04809 [Ramazzottius varieornatus]|uniref:Uncharacterized protein n=1 Tax=Ramazzottius varieornatus TaxID=947166 RepID=A0A1D1USX4_RAMVA|nr:hypothetical protein RvY_04809 [Ramazzottius varieornatus]
MDHSALLIVTIFCGSFAINLCRQEGRRSSFNGLDIAPLAETSDSVVIRTKRQWDKYGVEGGLRGMLWGLILGGLFHAPAPPAGGGGGKEGGDKGGAPG